MKNEDLVNIYYVLMNIGSLACTGKTAYVISKNIALIKPIIKLITQENQPGRDFLEYDGKRIELCKKYAQKKDDGEFVVRQGQYIIGDQKSFDKEMEKLRKKYDTAIKIRNDQEKKVKNILEGETEINLRLIPCDELPNGITPQQVDVLSDIIDESDSKIIKPKLRMMN